MDRELTFGMLYRFEFLAFTSDVKHFRTKKDMVGVSVRTILANVFTQLVVRESYPSLSPTDDSHDAEALPLMYSLVPTR